MRSSYARLLAPLVMALIALPVAARADDAADLKAKMTAAMQPIVSMRLTVQSPYGATGQMIVILRPATQMKMVMAVGPMNLEQYISGGFAYTRINGAWQKRALPSTTQALAFAHMITSDSTVTLVPDKTEDGIAFGALSFTMTTPFAFPGAPPTMALACTYDKKTFLMHRCANEMATITYAGFNDPANVVVLPDDAKNAPEGAPIALPASPAAATPVPSPAP